jgi:GPH family glycoside/pentoside/hexuronide:cation symporter
MSSSAASPITRKVQFFWGLGSFGTIGYLNIVTALVLVYLTAVLKMEPATAGRIVFVARLIDAFSDPLMGFLTDRTKSRWGRRRPWLLAGATVCGLALPLVYSQHLIPGFSGSVLGVLAALVVYSLGFTLFNVPYLAMPVEMTEQRRERIDLMSYRSLFMTLGGVAGNAGAPLLLKALGGDAHGYAVLGWVGGALVFLVLFACFLGTAKAPVVDTASENLPRQPFHKQIGAVFSNGPFLTMAGIKISQFIALSAAGATMAFFVLMVLKRDLSLMSLLAVSTVASTLLFIPVFRWLGKFITKRTGLAIGLAGETFAVLTWLFATPETSSALFVVRGVLAGSFGAAILLFSQAMWLDTIDYDRQKTGLRREGLYTSVYVFIERLGYSLGPLILGELLQAMNFDKTLPLEQQPAEAALAVQISLIGIPAAAYMIGLILLLFYRLPERLDDQVDGK